MTSNITIKCWPLFSKNVSNECVRCVGEFVSGEKGFAYPSSHGATSSRMRWKSITISECDDRILKMGARTPAFQMKCKIPKFSKLYCRCKQISFEARPVLESTQKFALYFLHDMKLLQLLSSFLHYVILFIMKIPNFSLAVQYHETFTAHHTLGVSYGSINLALIATLK